MPRQVDIYFNDLKPEKQLEILDALCIKNAKDAQLDVLPLTTYFANKVYPY